jgi:hypothetical protein
MMILVTKKAMTTATTLFGFAVVADENETYNK